MQRTKELEPLSHDHYNGLVVAERIRKGLGKKAETTLIAQYVAHFWEQHLSRHFDAEERLLLPILEETHATALAERMLAEHELIRELIGKVQQPGRAQPLLSDLARLMKSHIRFEEREVFPAIARRLSDERLQGVGAALDAHDTAEKADLDWTPAFWN